MKIGEIWTNTLDILGMAWWVEISTSQPQCTYFFGPFSNEQEAHLAQAGYVEDLEAESAQGIQVQVKRCKPNLLTIDNDPGRTVTASYGKRSAAKCNSFSNN